MKNYYDEVEEIIVDFQAQIDLFFEDLKKAIKYDKKNK